MGGIGISVGYSFEPKGLSIAPKTLANFLERKTQLYEHGAHQGQYYNYCPIDGLCARGAHKIIPSTAQIQVVPNMRNFQPVLLG
jgi:hypothetical protein